MHKRHYLLLCCGLLLIAAQALFAQNFSVPIRISDGSGTWADTLTIGANTAATTGKDAGLGEEELPPVPPSGVGDARIVSSFIGQGQKQDWHPVTVPDTFYIAFKSSDAAGATQVTFSWDSNISTKGAGGWRMEDVFTGTIVNVNMNGQTSYTIPAPYATPPQNQATVRIIVADAGAYRSFNAADFATAVDIKGKAKPQSKKPVASECSFSFAVPANAASVLVKLGQVATYGVSQTAGWSAPTGIGTKAVTYTWTGAPGAAPATLDINIGGNKGKANKAKGEFNVGAAKPVKVTGTLTNARLLLLFPNLQNMVYELYGQKTGPSFFGSLGVVAGVENYRKSVYHPKYSGVFATLNKKGVQHTGAAKCLDAFANGKPIGGTEVKPGKPLKGLPPDKHNNMLLAEQIALKLNVAGGDHGFITAGFGDLVYVDALTPQFDGKSVRQLMAKADSVLSCLDSSVTPGQMYAAVSGINNGFRAALDTIAWASGNVQWTSSVPISSVPILKRVTNAAPVMRGTGSDASYDMPSAFELSQNYPNPFNPTTTIEFSLVEDAFVTVKVYNVLGQEVATLADREEMLEGSNSVEFDATGLPSGIYYYRLTVNDGQFTAVNKMMLMK
jgi:hypothetical protein